MNILVLAVEYPFAVALGLGVGITFGAIWWAWIAGSER